MTIYSSETIATFCKKKINSEHIHLKLQSKTKCYGFTCSGINSRLSLFMIMASDFVCCTSELEF